ncbi:MAG TPA: hypothetical protein VF913_14270 [Xanthobacteraceae bacterium]
MSRSRRICRLSTTLRYPYEVRNHAEYFEDIPDIKLLAEMKELAGHIVDTKAGHFDPAEFTDHYENALVELRKQKQAGLPVESIKEAPPPSRVINLMDALRRSIEAERIPSRAPKRRLPSRGRPARKAG